MLQRGRRGPVTSAHGRDRWHRNAEGTGMARDEARFGINTYAYTGSHSAADCLSHLADQGYREFELMMVPGHLWPAHADAAARQALRQLVEDRGLRLVSLNMPNIDFNIAALAEEMRRHTLGLLHAILGLAGDLGVPGVVIGPGKANPLMPAPEDVLLGHVFRALDELAPHAERVGTRLCVENMPFAFLPKADQLMQALERYGDERIRVIYDVANAHFVGEDPGDGLRRVAPRLALVHLSDTPREVYRHSAIGQGSVPFAALPPVLAEVGYRAAPILELIAPDPDRALAASMRRLLDLGWPRRP
jgi:sugar phosphate isomerase/epimerase